jgi:N-acetylmuramoyl-L-alanine amidase
MPSILVETGFLTNPTEEKFMTSDSGLTILSACIYNGFAEYKTEMEKIKGNAKLVKPKFTAPINDAPSQANPVVSSTSNTPVEADLPAPEKPINPPAPKAPDYYSVQFYVSATPLNLDDARLKNVGKFTIEQDGQGKYHYMSDKLPDSMTALKMQNEFRKVGFNDAFMVLYKEGKRQPTGNVGDY